MSKCLAIGLIASITCLGQEAAGDRVNVPFSDPNAPKQLKVSLLNGSITIRGYDGKEAIVEARSGRAEHERTDKKMRTVRDVEVRIQKSIKAALERDKRLEGLRRIDSFATGLTVEEQNNVLRVGAGHGGDANLTIQVPANTSISASIVNGGDLIIENISGEIDANNTNGGIRMTNISGTVVAHALNDDVTVKMDKVAAGKPMSFSSLNGDIDVTFPADLKARLKLKSENGDIYSDFEIQMQAGTRQPVVEENRQKSGRYRVQFDRAMYGTINGGGQEIQLTTLNGKIMIRKSK